MPGPFQLSRFVTAQDGVYEDALRQIREGRKTSHWMWFIFPQLEGLGRSPTAQHFAIKCLAEARAYLEHPVLGPRLRECVQALLEVQGRSAAMIFGSPDDLKLRSSLTLFARAAGPPQSVFDDALAAYFDGLPDERTLAVLDACAGESP
jgi:uncharacterized protein (DUF1810 family)